MLMLLTKSSPMCCNIVNAIGRGFGALLSQKRTFAYTPSGVGEWLVLRVRPQYMADRGVGLLL